MWKLLIIILLTICCLLGRHYCQCTVKRWEIEEKQKYEAFKSSFSPSMVKKEYII